MEPRARLLGTVTLLGLGLALCAKFLLPMFAPFLAGLILACLFEPAVAFCTRRCRIPRWIAAGIILIAATALIGLILALIGVRLWFAVGAFLRTDRLAGLAGDLRRMLAAAMAGLPPSARAAILAGLGDLPGRLGGAGRHLLGVLSRLPEWFLFFFLSVLTAYLLSRDKVVLGRILLGLTPAEWRVRARGMLDELFRAMCGFIGAQAILLALTFAVGTTGLALLGVGEAVLVGAIIGLLDLLPLIGPGALLLPWAGLACALGDWHKGLGLAAVFAALAAVREAAEGHLVGRNLGLHPLAALAALYLGMRLFGPGGFLLGPVLLVLLRALYRVLALAGEDESRSGSRAKGVGHEANRRFGLDGFHRATGP